jgi:hypothetical protein
MSSTLLCNIESLAYHALTKGRGIGLPLSYSSAMTAPPTIRCATADAPGARRGIHPGTTLAAAQRIVFALDDRKSSDHDAIRLPEEYRSCSMLCLGSITRRFARLLWQREHVNSASVPCCRDRLSKVDRAALSATTLRRLSGHSSILCSRLCSATNQAVLRSFIPGSRSAL